MTDNTETTDAQAEHESTLMVRSFFGSFRLIEVGLFSFWKVWEPNPRLGMTIDEQARKNKQNHPDFQERVLVGPAVKIVLS